MNLDESRKELSVKGKNGVGFLLSGLVVWIVITVIFLQTMEVYKKSVFMMFSTGLMFPLSIMITKLIKADWKYEGSPLGSLGLYLNLAQLIYFPIVIWAIGKSPEEAVVFFAIITGAHFFPYGWFFDSKPYYIMSPIISVIIMGIGWTLDDDKLWLVPLSMVFLILLLILWIYIDYKRKSN